jgi:hypothetical protein
MLIKVELPVTTTFGFQYRFHRGVCRASDTTWMFRRRKNMFIFLGNEPGFLGHAACSHIAISSELPRLY